MSGFAVEDEQTILFIGDSITDCGRRGAEAPLGIGYVRLVSELATSRFSDRRIRYINKGIGGNRITDLKNRWQDDVVYHKPDWLSIKIGINDLSSHLNQAPGAVSPETFEETYDYILTETARTLGCQTLLISPFYISRDDSGATARSRYLDNLPTYIAVVEKMSQKYGTRLVKTHEMFQNHLQYRDADNFCPEPIHPHQAGHVAIAEAVVDALSA